MAYLGHVLLDNRHGLVANVCVTAATGTAERDAAAWMLAASAPPGRTVGADKGYDTARFVDEVRALVEVTPHIAQKIRYSALDGGTTRHPGYQVSQRKRKFVEQVFGWLKTVGGLRTLRHRGGALVDWIVTFAGVGSGLASNNGRSVNLPDHVRRLYAGLEAGRATDSPLRQFPTPQSARRPRHRCW